MSFFQITLSLFLVINSVGNIPLFIGLLGNYSLAHQRRIILRELAIALGILLLFAFFGDAFLKLIDIAQPVVGIAGGTLLFVIALGMIFPKRTPLKHASEEPLIVPLAIPLIAGPGAIASIMVYAEQLNNSLLIALALLVAWIPSAFILYSAASLKRLLGLKGLAACERLGGMLICLIAVNMFFKGVLTLIQTTFHIRLSA